MFLISLISKWKKLSFLAIALTVVTSEANAYDMDTHLRMTYANARWVGINHEVSLMLAMSSMWNDISLLTTPMGPLLTGSRLRRLFHFPGSRTVKIDNLDSHGSSGLNTITKTYRLDPMGSELIMEGMRKGYLPFVGNGIHTLQDTFGHEGWAAEIGHAHGGHEPDRPWRSWEKYKQMSLAVTRAMISIRELLPQEALDLETPRKKGLWSEVKDISDAQQLSDAFIKYIQPTVNNDIFMDARYTRPATEFILKNLKEMGFIRSGVDISSLAREELFDGQKDIHQIFRIIIHDVLVREVYGESILSKNKLLDDILRGYPLEEKENIFKQIAQFPDDVKESIANRIVMLILDKHVPDRIGETKLGLTNYFVWEPQNELRKLEMKIRMNDWRVLTNKMYDQDWHFVEPPPGLIKKTIEVLNMDVVVFFNLVRKSIFERASQHSMGKIFYKAMNAKDLVSVAARELEQQVRDFKIFTSTTQFVQMPLETERKWRKMIITFSWLDWMMGRGNRYQPQKNAMAYIFVSKIREMQARGEVKELIRGDEVLQLMSQIEIPQAELPLAIQEAIDFVPICKSVLVK